MVATKERRGRFFNQADKDHARSVNILSYLEACGESFQEISNGTFQHAEHDSLRYNAQKNVLNWFSQDSQKAAWNCIDAAMMMYNFSFTQAVHDILQKSQYIPETGIQQKIDAKPRNFDYKRDVKEVKNPQRALRYLIEERGLNERLIHYCVEEGLIAGDNRGNVVFKWKDMTKIKHKGLVGASLRGTREIPEEKRFKPDQKYYRGKLSGCQKNAGFFMDIGIPKKLVIGEAAIDVLSYISRKMNEGNRQELLHTRFASMEGLSKENFLRQYAAVNSIQKQFGNAKLPTTKFIIDNDQPAQDFALDLQTFAEGYSIEGKDFSACIHFEKVPVIELENGKIIKDQNDYLIYQKNLRRTQDIEKEQMAKQEIQHESRR